MYRVFKNWHTIYIFYIGILEIIITIITIIINRLNDKTSNSLKQKARKIFIPALAFFFLALTGWICFVNVVMMIIQQRHDAIFIFDRSCKLLSEFYLLRITREKLKLHRKQSRTKRIYLYVIYINVVDHVSQIFGRIWKKFIRILNFWNRYDITSSLRISAL